MLKNNENKKITTWGEFLKCVEFSFKNYVIWNKIRFDILYLNVGKLCSFLLKKFLKSDIDLNLLR